MNPAQMILTAVKFHHPEDLAREPELTLSCWPAYAHLSPHQRTRMFAQEYSQAFKEAFRKNVDYREAERVTGVDHLAILVPKRASGDAAKGGRLTSLNRARQFADSRGFPYLPFITFCMQFAANRGVVRVVGPHQLVPTKYRETWEKKLQEHFDDWKSVMVSHYRQELNKGRSDKRGCFAVPGAWSTASAVCVSCPQHAACALGVQRVLGKIQEIELRSGEPETFLRHRMRQNAERQRKNTLARRAQRAAAKTNAS